MNYQKCVWFSIHSDQCDLILKIHSGIYSSQELDRWICHNCHLKELPFFNTRNILEEDIATTGEIILNDVRSQALVTHKNHLRIANLNTQSVNSTFDEFQLTLYQHTFDIITLSDTWLRNDRNLYNIYKYQDITSAIESLMKDREAFLDCI